MEKRQPKKRRVRRKRRPLEDELERARIAVRDWTTVARRADTHLRRWETRLRMLERRAVDARADEIDRKAAELVKARQAIAKEMAALRDATKASASTSRDLDL